MTVPAVRNAVTLISTTIGALPFKVFERDGEEGKTVARDHPAYALVNSEASDEQSAEQFREQLTRDAILHGFGYGLVTRNFEGKPLELLRLDPTRVTTKQTAQGVTFYEFQSDTGKATFAFDQVLRLVAPGGSPIIEGRETIALALALDQAAARIFAKAGRPSGALTVPSTVGDTGLARIKAGWQAAHGGENSGGTAILENGATFEQFAYSLVDAEFSAMRKHQVIEIARLFNVPATMLQALENGTLSNVEQQALGFRIFTLGPWLAAWSRAYSRALVLADERGTFFAEAVTDGLLAADTAARTDQMQKLISSRVMTPNEARALINLPAHPQGDDLQNPYTSTGNTPAGPEQVAA